MEYIYHIAEGEAWQAGLMAEQYLPAAFKQDGFIHCSTGDQVIRTANRFYRGVIGLVLLKIDVARLEAPLKFENLEGGLECFPHIYGPLNLDAVIEVSHFTPDQDGLFGMPDIN